MTKRAARCVLVLHLVVVWAAAALRWDQFPLTWAPMYGVHKPSDTIRVRVLEPRDLSAGFVATRRDGTTRRVSMADLNIPKWNFWRLYYQRAFGGPPNKFRHGNAPLSPWLRSLRGLAPGEEPYRANWEWRVLRSVNATLGRAPGDAEFIVRLEARQKRARFSKRDLRSVSTSEEMAVLEWRADWSMDRNAEPL